MKKSILLTIFSFLAISYATAQTVILDFEEAATTTTFQYFGSSLEGTLNNVIANPDASGINTSATVGDFVKPTDAQTWAGAFANPAIAVPVILTTDNQICVKVWMPAAGNLALKLEGGDQSDWIRTIDVNEAETWVEICYNTDEPSIEDPFMPASGGTYNAMVLFFDFGMTVPEERTYYFDDIVTQGGSSEPVDVTFSVDMNDYFGIPVTTVYVSGTFNGWSGNANPLSDDDGDGVWTGTVTGVDVGLHEYKFTADDWLVQENFNGTETCTVTDPSGQFHNRRLLATSDATLETVCFNSCYACGQGVNITINLGQGGLDVSEEGLYIAGGGNFGNPGDFPLTDNGDGTWSITMERQVGFESFYTFTNGACPDFSCKENIAGQDCADPDNFNDRKMGPITEDTVINTCFGECTTTTNCSGAQGGNITFQVDMNGYGGAFTTVYVSGTFNGWSGDANPLTDDDGDGIWETTLPLSAGNIEYKFQVDAWAVAEEFAEGAPCTITGGGFTNRALTVDGDETVCFFWNTCDACGVEGSNITFQVDMNEYMDAFETVYLSGTFNNWGGDNNPLTDDDGDGIWETTVPMSSGNQEFKFQLDAWAVSEEFEDGDPCTITDPSGQFVNRLVVVDGAATICFLWETCTECGANSVFDIEVDHTIFSVQPNLVSNETLLIFGDHFTDRKEINVINAIGQVVSTIRLQAGVDQYLMDVKDLHNGIYFINVRTEGKIQTQKIIVSH